jgi:hypothetical protein
LAKAGQAAPDIEGFKRVKESVTSQAVCGLAKVGLMGSRSLRWKAFSDHCDKAAVQEWARDLDYSNYLAEGKRVSSFMLKKLASWNRKPVGERIREVTSYSALMLVVDAARRLSFAGFRLRAGEGRYKVAELAKIPGARPDSLPVRLNGLPLPSFGPPGDGQKPDAYAVYHSQGGEAVMFVRDGRLANDLCASLNSSEAPKICLDGVPEAAKLIEGKVKPIVEREAKFKKLTVEESARISRRIIEGLGPEEPREPLGESAPESPGAPRAARPGN